MLLYIVRHGQSASNAGAPIRGEGEDTRLSAIGREQADLLGDYLKNIQFDAIYSSSMRRACETALGVAAHQKSGIKVRVVPQLCEVREDFSFVPTDNFLPAHKEKLILPADLAIGEFSSEKKRADYVIDNFAMPLAYSGDLLPKGNGEDANSNNVLFAAHGVFNAYLLSSLTGIPFDRNMIIQQANTCINVIEFFEYKGVRRKRFKAFNFTPHLPADLIT